MDNDTTILLIAVVLSLTAIIIVKLLTDHRAAAMVYKPDAYESKQTRYWDETPTWTSVKKTTITLNGDDVKDVDELVDKVSKRLLDAANRKGGSV